MEEEVVRCSDLIDNPEIAARAGELLDYCLRHGIDVFEVTSEVYEWEILPKIAEERQQKIIALFPRRTT